MRYRRRRARPRGVAALTARLGTVVVLDPVGDLVGDEVVERAPIDGTGSQVGARHLEPRHHEALPPPPARRRRRDRARTVDDDDRGEVTHLLPALPREQPGGRVLTQDHEQLPLGSSASSVARVSAV